MFNHSLYYESWMFPNVTKVILKPYWYIYFIVKHKLKKLRHASDRFDSQNYSSFSCAERYVSLIQPVTSILLIRFWSRNEYRNFYSPRTFKIVALQMATRPLFVPVSMSTVVPSFNSTAPTTFFLLQHSRCSRFPIKPRLNLSLEMFY